VRSGFALCCCEASALRACVWANLAAGEGVTAVMRALYAAYPPLQAWLVRAEGAVMTRSSCSATKGLPALRWRG
jgi:hypothetical protein